MINIIPFFVVLKSKKHAMYICSICIAIEDLPAAQNNIGREPQQLPPGKLT